VRPGRPGDEGVALGRGLPGGGEAASRRLAISTVPSMQVGALVRSDSRAVLVRLVTGRPRTEVNQGIEVAYAGLLEVSKRGRDLERRSARRRADPL